MSVTVTCLKSRASVRAAIIVAEFAQRWPKVAIAVQGKANPSPKSIPHSSGHIVMLKTDISAMSLPLSICC